MLVYLRSLTEPEVVQLVGDKAKGRNLETEVNKQNKTRQIFRKTNISYPLIHTRMCTYQRVRNVRFSEIWCALFSCHLLFQTFTFALSPTNYGLSAVITIIHDLKT